ncbi:MAG: collagen-like protein [Bryobacterales bacterium]|nr:collagen-like protein [Bryobacterales bacterium]
MHRPRSVLCAFGCAFTAAAIDLPVAADAVVRTTLPAANFGALPQLQADPTSRALLKFDLSSLPASLNAASLVRASLNLYASRVITPGGVTILGNSSPWQEAAVTNNTQPGGAGTLTSFDASEAGKFYTIDVTSAVASWLATPEFSAYGISLVSPGAIFIDSKKNTATSHAPTLTLIFSRPQGPQGPQGIRGVPGVTGAPGRNGDPGPASLSSTWSRPFNRPWICPAPRLPATHSSAPPPFPGFWGEVVVRRLAASTTSP